MSDMYWMGCDYWMGHTNIHPFIPSMGLLTRPSLVCHICGDKTALYLLTGAIHFVIYASISFGMGLFFWDGSVCFGMGLPNWQGGQRVD